MTVFDDFQQDGAFLGIQWYKEGIIEDEQLTPLYLLHLFSALGHSSAFSPVMHHQLT